MRRLAIIGVLFALLPSAALADHGRHPHWPTTVTAHNGKTCDGAPANCRKVKVIDRTGYAAGSFYDTQLVTGLNKLWQASGGLLIFHRVKMSRVDVGCGDLYNDAALLTPVGAIMVARSISCGPGAKSVGCGSALNVPAWPEPYCNADGTHATKGVVGVNSTSWGTFAHEAGHTIGLGDTYNLLPEPCGVGGPDLMCGTSWLFFNQHSKDVLASLYGHSP